MGFVPQGGFRTTPIASPTTPSSSSAPSIKAAHEPEEVVQAAGPRGAIRGPAKWKDGRPVFEHGNYAQYYGYRLARPEQDEDPRLVALRGHFGGDVFLDKEVLDIGCNAGLVSLGIARSFGARRVVGLDIDANLIEAAQTQHETQGAGGAVVEFRAEDILQSPLRRAPDAKPEKFDVILLLSVTKWVHFAHGDVGVQRLFKRCIKRLRPGGLLVLEPQEWSSYKKKRHLSREIRDRVSGIIMPPKAFKECLIGMGLETAGKIKPEGDVIKGFQRPILLFRKPAIEEIEENKIEEVSAPCSSGPSGEDQAKPKKRRKSVE